MASRQMHGASKMFDFRCHSNRASAFVPPPRDYGATGNATTAKILFCPRVVASGSLSVRIIILFSQAFEDRHFTEREISFETLNEVKTIWTAASGLEDSYD